MQWDADGDEPREINCEPGVSALETPDGDAVLLAGNRHLMLH